MVEYPQDLVLDTLNYCAWNLNRAMEIFDAGGIILSARDAIEASQSLLDHLRSYQFLNGHHGIPNAMLFRMRPKAHYLWHTAKQTRVWMINRCVFHCFQEESWLGHCKRIALQCHGKTMTYRIYERYLICLALYLENHKRAQK